MIKLEIVDEGMEEAEQRSLADAWDKGCPCCCNRTAPTDWDDLRNVRMEELEPFWESGGTADLVWCRSKVRKILSRALSSALVEEAHIRVL